jgi:hypothetical protein
MSDKRFVLAGVMGWPVAHTRSPAIHNHWIAIRSVIKKEPIKRHLPKFYSISAQGVRIATHYPMAICFDIMLNEIRYIRSLYRVCRQTFGEGENDDEKD